jgi:2-oxo-4-hydroxy-4-carboxy-5-ureidoimidazoline decarboxylase
VVLLDLPGQLTLIGHGILRIDEVNELADDAFITAFANVFESTPSLAAAAAVRRPFADRQALVDAFVAAADRFDEGAVLALLRAHPQLAAAGPMTEESTAEQQAAGLTDLDVALRSRIRTANAAYLEKFGFPFIIAVRGLGPADIDAALAERLDHDPVEERATALAQVKRIAALRIAALVAP